jgi:hypothetical protein
MTLLGSGGNENDDVSDDDESNAIKKPRLGPQSGHTSIPLSSM